MQCVTYEWAIIPYYGARNALPHNRSRCCLEMNVPSASSSARIRFVRSNGVRFLQFYMRTLKLLVI